MQRKYNRDLVPYAKELRSNMTKEERHLWYDFLRKYPVKFTRQKVLGNYIADFYSAEAKLVIELDGTQHKTEDSKEYDRKRTEYLEQFGLRVIRITNYQLNKNFKEICYRIDCIVRQAVRRNNE